MASKSSVKDVQPTKMESSPRKWFVLISGFFILFCCTGFPFNMAVLNPELLRTFGESKAQTALVQSFTIGMLYIAGLGFSATFISAFTAVGEYFEGKSKLMALSFLSFGSGCGALIVPYLLHTLIEEFGWRGCLLIVGGLFANMICFFAVCKPVIIGLRRSTSKELKGNDSESTSPEDGFMKSVRSLVTSRVYLIYIVAMCFTLPVINSAMIFILDFLATKGFDSETRINMYLYLQLGNATFRFVPGLCKKYIPHTSVLVIPACFTAIGSMATGLLPHVESFTHMVVLLVCLGMALGVSITTISMTTMKLVGLHKYSAGLGILMTVMGVSNCFGGPTVGLFIDMTGSYTQPFYCMSGGLGLATFLFLLATALNQKPKTNPLDKEIDISIVEIKDNPSFTP